MGGRSSAQVRFNQRGQLVWEGNLSLENNGGFVSLRSQSPWADWSSYDGVEVVFEAPGRDVQVSVQRGDMVLRAGGYRAMVPAEAEGDTHVFIPFSAFVLKRFGRAIRGPALREGLKQIGRLGLLIADKREGPFKVVLKSIQPAHFAEGMRLSSKVRPVLVKAIEAGVPVFNGGDHKGCALIYRKALRGLSDASLLGKGTWALRVSKHALKRASQQSDTEAAWTLRGAIDAILKSSSD